MTTDKSRPTPEADPPRPGELLARTIAAVEPASVWAAEEANALQARLTKPRGSLGRLEQLGARLAAAYGVCPPLLPHPAAVAVFAGDHGVHAQGVSPWPQEVTAQMVGNLADGGAVVCALARQVGASVCVVDVGVAVDLPETPNLLQRKVAHGTADMTAGPAMSADDAADGGRGRHRRGRGPGGPRPPAARHG